MSVCQRRTEAIVAKFKEFEYVGKRGERELFLYSSRRSDYLVAISLLGSSKHYDVRVALSPNRTLPYPYQAFSKMISRSWFLVQARRL